MPALFGQPYVNANILNPGSFQPPLGDIVVGNSSKIENTSVTNIIAASPGPTLRYYVTDVLVTNGDATIGTLVTIRDSSGVVITTGFAAANGGGFSHSFRTHIPCSPGAHIEAVCETDSAEVYVSVAGYKAA